MEFNFSLGRRLLLKQVFIELVIFIGIRIGCCLGLVGRKEDQFACFVGIIWIIRNLQVPEFRGWIEDYNKLAVEYWNQSWNFAFMSWNFNPYFIKLQIINSAKQLFIIHFNFEQNSKQWVCLEFLFLIIYYLHSDIEYFER